MVKTMELFNKINEHGKYWEKPEKVELNGQKPQFIGGLEDKEMEKNGQFSPLSLNDQWNIQSTNLLFQSVHREQVNELSIFIGAPVGFYITS